MHLFEMVNVLCSRYIKFLNNTIMKNVVKESKPQVEPHVITSRNSPELAQRIRQASAAILKRNYNLYKELENK